MFFHGEALLAPRPTPKLEDQPSSAVRDCLFNISAATLGTTLTNQNSIQEEIKSRLKLGSACYYSVQNLLSSILLSKTLKIKIYTT